MAVTNAGCSTLIAANAHKVFVKFKIKNDGMVSRARQQGRHFEHALPEAVCGAPAETSWRTRNATMPKRHARTKASIKQCEPILPASTFLRNLAKRGNGEALGGVTLENEGGPACRPPSSDGQERGAARGDPSIHHGLGCD